MSAAKHTEGEWSVLEHGGEVFILADAVLFDHGAFSYASSNHMAFRLVSIPFFGGLMGNHRDAGPWAQSQTKKSALTLNTASWTRGSGKINTDASKDAWYYGKTLLPSTDPNTIYYRYTVVLKVVMPNVRKADNSPYYVDLWFNGGRGDGILDAVNNKFDLYDDAAPIAWNGFWGYNGNPFLDAFHARVMTDGGTYHLSIPVSNIGLGTQITNQSNVAVPYPVSYLYQGVVVRWNRMDKEAGAPGGADPTSVEIERMEWDYLTPNSGVNPTWAFPPDYEQFTYAVWYQF